jgi:hypothetical protein
MRGRPRGLRLALALVAIGWVALLLLAPRWASAQPDGAARWTAATAAVLVRLAGAQICHQRPERSFHLHGRALAVCGRCTGLYVAGALGLLAAAVGGRGRGRGAVAAPRSAWWPSSFDPRMRWLALAALPTAVTWGLEMAGLWNPGTPLRALAALPLGLVAGWLAGRALPE